MRAVTKRLRYEILKRDNFTCRYCGAKAPGVQLHVDHVIPVSLGGDNSASNLAAACSDCNNGKSSSSPDAQTVDEVSEHDLRWREALHQAVEEDRNYSPEVQEAIEYVHALFEHITFIGISEDKAIASYVDRGLPADEVMDAANIARFKQGIVQSERLRYLFGICRMKLANLQERAAQIMATQEAAG